jgi:hypothetical protein
MFLSFRLEKLSFFLVINFVKVRLMSPRSWIGWVKASCCNRMSGASISSSILSFRESGSADVGALVVPDQNPTIAKFKNSLWVPPLVLLSILEAQSLVPADLIPVLSVKFQEFDKSSATIKAYTILRPVLEFLWAAHKKLVPPTTLALENSSDAVEWSSRQHFAYICAAPLLPPPPPFPVPPAPGNLSSSSPF